jgi:hypothetical protein
MICFAGVDLLTYGFDAEPVAWQMLTLVLVAKAGAAIAKAPPKTRPPARRTNPKRRLCIC